MKCKNCKYRKNIGNTSETGSAICSYSSSWFPVNIENNYGEKFRCPVYIDIPLNNDASSIYDGSYIYTYNPNWIFAKIN